MKIKCALNRFCKMYSKIEEIFLVACLVAMGLVLAVQILLRYVFKSPIPWAEELARYLQIWITFFGLGYAYRNKGHIALDLLLEKLNPKLSKIVCIINDIVMIACSVVVIYAAPTFLRQQHKLSSTLHVPLYLVYGMIPVGFGILILYLLADIFNRCDSKSIETKEEIK